MIRHEKTHIKTDKYIEMTENGERPYACNFCDKRYFKKSHLSDHEKTHTGEKPFACNLCDKRFTTKSLVTKHEKICTGKQYLFSYASEL